MTLLIAILALLATLYQLYLQRMHNEKSLRPLGQIDFRDRSGQLYIRVSNNGVGPMIVDRLRFTKGGIAYTAIEDCLQLDKRSYARLDGHELVRKVILPNVSLTIFETCFDEHEAEAAIEQARQQLAPITLQVAFRDIYDNRMTIGREFSWFLRHTST